MRKSCEVEDEDHRDRKHSEDPVQGSPRKVWGSMARQQLEQRVRIGFPEVQNQVRVHIRTQERRGTENKLTESRIECEVLLASGNPQQWIDGGLEGCHSGAHDEKRDYCDLIGRMECKAQRSDGARDKRS